LEKDWIPPDETLQRLCALFEWNYQEIKRLADNIPSPRNSKTIPPNQQSSSVDNNSAESAPTALAKLIKDAREAVNQDALGIATLMGISVDYYQEFENGVIPPDELLRKLCSLFGWNYKQILQKNQLPDFSSTRQTPTTVSCQRYSGTFTKAGRTGNSGCTCSGSAA
jgi:DNA-binding transcriptional regulator YiaG